MVTTVPPVDRTAPLDGILVADFSRILAGPLATQTLGDLGADVVKVEAPGGDDTRSWGPPFTPDGTATYALAANRNKRSLVLDLRDAGDRKLARTLALRADVVVANLKPGAMERFGLGYEDLAAEHPRLVYCAINGFGSGAGAELPGYDPLVQAVGGLMSVTGPDGGDPVKVGVALVDVIAGLNAAVGILAALRERDRSGQGQMLEITLLGTVLAALANQATGYLNAAAVPRPLGTRHPSIEPFATYACADGPLMICAGNDRQFAALSAALGLAELTADPRFATNADRVVHHAELRPLLESALSAATSAEWAERLSAAGVPAGPVNDLAGAFGLAEDLGLDIVDDHAGIRTPASPVGLYDTPPTTRRPPPTLDEHGDELRAWLSGPR
ncbi:MAG: CoA transferase [Solirubrobacteraceae bacterium]|nr:CoA transferase [Solirubrobacteraceae bacterium]